MKPKIAVKFDIGAYIFTQYVLEFQYVRTFILYLLEMSLIQNPLSIDNKSLQATLEIIQGCGSGRYVGRKSSNVVDSGWHLKLCTMHCN